MIPEIFDILNGQVIINHNCLSIPELKAVHDRYKDPIPAFNFLHYMYSQKGPYCNTPEDDNDGQKYKGRGYIMITGLANYKELSKDTGIDFVTHPELLEQEVNAMVAALWFWNKRKLNQFADLDDIKTITKKINGGYNGLKERQDYLVQYKKIFT